MKTNEELFEELKDKMVKDFESKHGAGSSLKLDSFYVKSLVLAACEIKDKEIEKRDKVINGLETLPIAKHNIELTKQLEMAKDFIVETYNISEGTDNSLSMHVRLKAFINVKWDYIKGFISEDE